MSDEGKPLRPEHIFKKVIWRSTLGLGTSIEQFTSWTITGIAAIMGLLAESSIRLARLFRLGDSKAA